MIETHNWASAQKACAEVYKMYASVCQISGVRRLDAALFFDYS